MEDFSRFSERGREEEEEREREREEKRRDLLAFKI